MLGKCSLMLYLHAGKMWSSIVIYAFPPYRMKIYTKINLATWLTVVNFMKLSISQLFFEFLVYKLSLKDLKRSKDIRILNLVNLPLAKFEFHENLLLVGYHLTHHLWRITSYEIQVHMQVVLINGAGSSWQGYILRYSNSKI